MNSNKGGQRPRVVIMEGNKTIFDGRRIVRDITDNGFYESGYAVVRNKQYKVIRDGDSNKWIGNANEGQSLDKSNRGGHRNPPGGRKPLPPDQKREPHSPTLAPGIRELAEAIAQDQGLPTWCHALDAAVRRWAAQLNIKVQSKK